MLLVQNLPEPKCPQGYTHDEVRAIMETEQETERFWDWMVGQTQSICDGRTYSHEDKEYRPTKCADNPHGIITYYWDVERYVNHHQNGTVLIWD